KENRYTCYACAIMPDHIHGVIRKHKHQAEEMIENLQNYSRAAILEAKLRSFDHPVWGGPGWKVFLETEEDIRRTIHYTDDNPIKTGRQRQSWVLVTPYDGWLPGGRMRQKP